MQELKPRNTITKETLQALKAFQRRGSTVKKAPRFSLILQKQETKFSQQGTITEEDDDADDYLEEQIQLFKDKGIQAPDPEYIPTFEQFVSVMMKALKRTEAMRLTNKIKP